ncbi:MAG TPA: hypothetical protein PKD83_09845 [Ignavibacteria bacterium]|nr:hypothetical protein [Ignavibacteria bacterium]
MCLIFSTNNSFSQDIKSVPPVKFLNNLIKYSTGIGVNNLNHNGTISGYKDEVITYIMDIQSQGTFSFETKNYDSIQFYFEWDLDENHIYKVKKSYPVLDNQPFEFEANEIMVMSGAEMIVANNQLKSLAGKKLYEVIISDDVNPDWIKVEALPEASKYIDVLKLDSSTYQIKLKGKQEFFGNLSEDLREQWVKGEEIKFPIGVNMYDSVVTTDTGTIQYFLVKKKKPKKVKN